RLQLPRDPLSGQPCVLVRDLDASGGVALQHGGQHGSAAAGEGVQDMASGLGDLHDVPHELEWLLRQVDAVLGIAVLEYTGEAGHRAADGHITIGAPDNVLRLLPEPALLGPAVALVPDSGAAPDPPRPLEGIAGRRELTPVNEHTHRGAG
ncbi:transcription antitermination factor NusB, partial [Dysosmobacter welbionis]